MRNALTCLLCGIAAFAAAGAAGDQPTTARLTVRVVDWRNRAGQAIFSVFNQAKGFPGRQDKSVNWQIRKLDDAEVIFTADLAPGRYAACVLHDENCNGRLDTNLIGIPTEGYGVTNNPKPRFRAARFNEAAFELPAEGAELTISLQYF